MKRRINDPAGMREKSRKWRAENPAKLMLRRARTRAERKGLKFNIALEDLLPLPTFCPVYGLRLVYDGGAQQDATASIDRIENDKGYVKGNVAVISIKANSDKQGSTLARLHERLSETEVKLGRIRALIDYVSGRQKDA
jgi:hypothetical protein